jgi:hypothetical protein
MADDNVYRSRSEFHKNELFYELNEEEYRFEGQYNSKQYADTTIRIDLGHYGSSLKQSVDETPRLNMSFLRTVGISKGKEFVFPGVYSAEFVGSMEEAFDIIVSTLYIRNSAIIKYEPEDRLAPPAKQLISVKLPKVKDAIDLVGVELEGGWTELPPHISSWHDLGKDGSVETSEDDLPSTSRAYNRDDDDEPEIRDGELRSAPMKADKICGWVARNLPQAVNSTCGFHVHMSLVTDYHYSLLMSREFYNALKAHFNKWGKQYGIPKSHPFWDRLNGSNDFCEGAYYHNPDEQAQVDDHEDCRYYTINYCLNQHGTVEFRFLPMWNKKDKKIAIAALSELIEFVRSWLAHVEERPRVNLIRVSDLRNRKVKAVTLGDETVNRIKVKTARLAKKPFGPYRNVNIDRSDESNQY